MQTAGAFQLYLVQTRSIYQISIQIVAGRALTDADETALSEKQKAS